MKYRIPFAHLCPVSVAFFAFLRRLSSTALLNRSPPSWPRSLSQRYLHNRLRLRHPPDRRPSLLLRRGDALSSTGAHRPLGLRGLRGGCLLTCGTVSATFATRYGTPKTATGTPARKRPKTATTRRCSRLCNRSNQRACCRTRITKPRRVTSSGCCDGFRKPGNLWLSS